MQPFTYGSYLYYKRFYKEINKGSMLNLNDVNEEYNIGEKIVNQPHDKIFKEVLDDKEETVKFINEALKIKNTKYALDEKDIEKYNRKFITDNFLNMESDVIYKKKNQNVFFLIEHQSTIDYSMPYRILKYNMAIMESAIDTKKVKNKNYKLPIIFSFVIYTGNKKWDANSYLIEKQEKLIGCSQKEFANFQVVDINNYTKEELLKSENLLSKIMLLEKARNIDELENYLQDIVEKQMEYRQKIFLKRVITYVFKDRIDKQKLGKFIEKLEEKEGEKSMLAEKVNMWIDEIIEEKMKQKEKEYEQKENEYKQKENEYKQKEKKYKQKEKRYKQREKEYKKKEFAERRKAINTAKDKIIIEMIRNNIEEDVIIKIAEINKEDLNKIKKENDLCNTKNKLC